MVMRKLGYAFLAAAMLFPCAMSLCEAKQDVLNQPQIDYSRVSDLDNRGVRNELREIAGYLAKGDFDALEFQIKKGKKEWEAVLDYLKDNPEENIFMRIPRRAYRKGNYVYAFCPTVATGIYAHAGRITFSFKQKNKVWRVSKAEYEDLPVEMFDFDRAKGEHIYYFRNWKIENDTLKMEIPSGFMIPDTVEDDVISIVGLARGEVKFSAPKGQDRFFLNRLTGMKTFKSDFQRFILTIHPSQYESLIDGLDMEEITESDIVRLLAKDGGVEIDVVGKTAAEIAERRRQIKEAKELFLQGVSFDRALKRIQGDFKIRKALDFNPSFRRFRIAGPNRWMLPLKDPKAFIADLETMKFGWVFYSYHGYGPSAAFEDVFFTVQKPIDAATFDDRTFVFFPDEENRKTPRNLKDFTDKRVIDVRNINIVADVKGGRVGAKWLLGLAELTFRVKPEREARDLEKIRFGPAIAANPDIPKPKRKIDRIELIMDNFLRPDLVLDERGRSLFFVELPGDCLMVFLNEPMSPGETGRIYIDYELKMIQEYPGNYFASYDAYPGWYPYAGVDDPYTGQIWLKYPKPYKAAACGEVVSHDLEADPPVRTLVTRIPYPVPRFGFALAEYFPMTFNNKVLTDVQLISNLTNKALLHEGAFTDRYGNQLGLYPDEGAKRKDNKRERIGAPRTKVAKAHERASKAAPSDLQNPSVIDWTKEMVSLQDEEDDVADGDFESFDVAGDYDQIPSEERKSLDGPKWTESVEFTIDGPALLGLIEVIVNFYEKMYGPYSLNQLQLVQIPYYNDYETGFPGNIVLPNGTLQTEASLMKIGFQPFLVHDYYIAERIACQWWGQQVPINSQHDFWLVAGLSRFSAMLWVQSKAGNSYYKKILKNEKMKIGYFNDRTPLWAIGEQQGQAFHAVSYSKAAWVFHMLRMMITEKGFVNVMSGLVKFSREVDRPITTQDLVFVCDKTLGSKNLSQQFNSITLQWFFNQWVYSTGMPSYSMEYGTSERMIRNEKKYILDVVITQENDDFTMPVPITIHFKDGDEETRRIMVNRKSVPKSMVFSKPIKKVVLDEYMAVLCNKGGTTRLKNQEQAEVR